MGSDTQRCRRESDARVGSAGQALIAWCVSPRREETKGGYGAGQLLRALGGTRREGALRVSGRCATQEECLGEPPIEPTRAVHEAKTVGSFPRFRVAETKPACRLLVSGASAYLDLHALAQHLCELRSLRGGIHEAETSLVGGRRAFHRRGLDSRQRAFGVVRPAVGEAFGNRGEERVPTGLAGLHEANGCRRLVFGDVGGVLARGEVCDIQLVTELARGDVE